MKVHICHHRVAKRLTYRGAQFGPRHNIRINHHIITVEQAQRHQPRQHDLRHLSNCRACLLNTLPNKYRVA